MSFYHNRRVLLIFGDNNYEYSYMQTLVELADKYQWCSSMLYRKVCSDTPAL